MRRQDESRKGLRWVARQSLVYGLGNLGASAIALLLIPLFTRRLVPSEYGFLEIAETAIALATLVFSLGLEASLMRYYFLFSSDEGKCRAVSSIALASLIPLLVASVPVIWGRSLWGRTLFRGEGFSTIILLAYGISAATVLCQMGLGYIRSRERALHYAGLNAAKLLIYALLSCIAVLLMSGGVKGILWASFLASSLVGAISFTVMLKEVGFGLSWEKILRGLRYGVPLVPSGLALWVIASSDRYFLARYNGLAAVGIYSLGYKLGMAPMFAFSAFQLAWPQFAFRIAEDPEAGHTFARLTRYTALGGGMAFLLLSLFAKEWVGLLAGGAYQDASQVIPLVALAHLGYTAYFLFATGITIKEKTGWLPLITGIAGVVNLAANLLLIPRFGPMGAALSTLFGYVALAGLTYAFSNHYLAVPYEFERLARIGGVVLGVWLLSLLFASSPVYFLDLGGRIALCFAFPLLAVMVGGITSEELKKIRSKSF